MLTPFMRYTALLFALQLAPSANAAADSDCTDLDCLLCPAMQDPDSYLEGNMKLMRELTPGKDRWLFRSEVDLTNSFGMPRNMTSEYARLIAALADKGIELGMILQPTRGLMHRDKVRPDRAMGFDYEQARNNYDAYLAQLRHAGALVPDLTQLLDHPPQQEYFFRRDHHWTSDGARATARLVADYILQQPIYPQLSNKQYLTEEGLTQYKDGTLNLALGSLCGNDFGFQYVPGYRTVPAVNDVNALFDEQPDPEVILLGTSNSAARDEENKQFNFDGFLKEYLSIDLLNFARPGAGEYGAVVEYLNSASYSPDSPPKLILWELPANYTLADPLMYRQLIPAIEGQCAEGETVLSKRQERSSLKAAERIELLSNTGAGRRSLGGYNGYLDIRIGDRDVKDFYIIVYYDNGTRDKVWIRREAIVSGGQYYLELSKAAEFRNANLLSVFMEPTETSQTPTTLEVRLCR
nr:alginate biosynthesis protein AlgX [Pseudomonas sp. 5Ae-yellow]